MSGSTIYCKPIKLYLTLRKKWIEGKTVKTKWILMNLSSDADQCVTCALGPQSNSSILPSAVWPSVKKCVKAKKGSISQGNQKVHAQCSPFWQFCCPCVSENLLINPRFGLWLKKFDKAENMYIYVLHLNTKIQAKKHLLVAILPNFINSCYTKRQNQSLDSILNSLSYSTWTPPKSAAVMQCNSHIFCMVTQKWLR